jgi:hypothetical protein
MTVVTLILSALTLLGSMGNRPVTHAAAIAPAAFHTPAPAPAPRLMRPQDVVGPSGDGDGGRPSPTPTPGG